MKRCDNDVSVFSAFFRGGDSWQMGSRGCILVDKGQYGYQRLKFQEPKWVLEAAAATTETTTAATKEQLL